MISIKGRRMKHIMNNASFVLLCLFYCSALGMIVNIVLYMMEYISEDTSFLISFLLMPVMVLSHFIGDGLEMQELKMWKKAKALEIGEDYGAALEKPDREFPWEEV